MMGFVTRRAIMGTLLRSGRAMSITELADVLRAGSPAWFGAEDRLNARISDSLRYQVRIGRAERVGRGVYRARPETFSRSTRWRYEHWERLTE